MGEKYGPSQNENELNAEYDEIHVIETKGNLRPDHDNKSVTFEKESQNIREEPQSSQKYEVKKHDTNQDPQNTIHLPTVPVDYKTIKELQKKTQPNINYSLVMASLVNNQKLSLESSNLKNHSVSVENAVYGTSHEEKQLLARYIETPKDLTFPQHLNVYCNPLINMDGSQFRDKNARHSFIRKVEIIHFFILIFTLAGVAVFDFVEGPNRQWSNTSSSSTFSEVSNSTNTSVSIVSGGTHMESYDSPEIIFIYEVLFWTTLALLIVLSICFGCMYFIAKLFPVNIIYMVFFVLLQIVCFGSFDICVGLYAALTGLIITLMVLLLIMVISWQNKWDIASCSFIIFIGLTAFALAAAYFVIIMLSKKEDEEHFYILYAGIVVSVYCMLNLFITQIIMVYKKYEITTEDTLPAAVLFYFMDFRRLYARVN